MSETANIAVVILAFNESLHLRRAIEHAAPFARQIFVVDSYSTDDTVELAASMGAGVVQHPFENYARQFQWALDNLPITTDWVMRLDADEVVEADLAGEILRSLSQLPAEVSGIYLNCKTIFQGRFIRHGGRYPLRILRIWRRGKARIEDRWMDEHMYLTDGAAVTFAGGFANDNLQDLTFFTAKHNQYASREALAILNSRHRFLGQHFNLTGTSTTWQARVRRFTKEKIYDRLPYPISATAYFLLRYVFQLGVLDGKEGLVYHFLQGFWYRFLIGAKVRELEAAIRTVSSKDELCATLNRLTRVRVDNYLRGTPSD